MEKDKKEVTINLDTLGVPIAIIIAALIIAGVVYLTNTKRNNVDDANKKTTSSATQDGTGSTDTADSATANNDTTTKEVKASLGNDPFVGNKSTAKVAIVEYSDPTCSYCKRHSDETYPDIKKNYIDTGKAVYVFKEWPRGNNGSLTYEISEGGMCVFDQKGSEVFVEYHKGAFNVSDIAGIKTLATKLGVNVDAFDKCMSDGKFVDDLKSDQEEGNLAGISGTPGFVVGKLDADGNVTGELIAGAFPYSKFESVIEAYLK